MSDTAVVHITVRCYCRTPRRTAEMQTTYLESVLILQRNAMLYPSPVCLQTSRGPAKRSQNCLDQVGIQSQSKGDVDEAHPKHDPKAPPKGRDGGMLYGQLCVGCAPDGAALSHRRLQLSIVLRL